jgi:putative ABC transport system permease protein
VLRNYLVITGKILLRRKFFTFVSLFGIGLTMMVLLVGVAFADHTLAAHAPEVNADRTLGIYRVALEGPNSVSSSSCGYAFAERFRSLSALPGVERLSVVGQKQSVLSFLGTGGDRRVESELRRVDGQFWKVMRFRFLEGGPFTDADEVNGSFVAVINRATRERFFGGAKALGKSLEADGQTFRVVGVVENVPALRESSAADLWAPISTAKSSDYKRQWLGPFSLLIVARGRADFPQIKAEVDRLVKAAVKDLENPETFQQINTGADTPFERQAREMLATNNRKAETGKLALLLFAGAVLFMTLPAVNLVNLNLSRILDRASEIGVRRAFGASSRTLAGQFVVENVLLTLLGSVLGVALAAAALAALNASGAVAYSDFALNGRVFLAGLALALFFGLLSGVYPAWRMSRLHPVQALSGRSR